MDVRCAHFSPSTMHFELPTLNLTSAMFRLDTTPPTVPASSPLDRLISLLTVQTLAPTNLTFSDVDCELLTVPMFGYGRGTGPPGLGVLQASMGPVVTAWPPAFVAAGNISPPLAEVDPASVNLDVFARALDYPFSVQRGRPVHDRAAASGGRLKEVADRAIAVHEALEGCPRHGLDAVCSQGQLWTADRDGAFGGDIDGAARPDLHVARNDKAALAPAADDADDVELILTEGQHDVAGHGGIRVRQGELGDGRAGRQRQSDAIVRDVNDGAGPDVDRCACKHVHLIPASRFRLRGAPYSSSSRP